MIKKIISVLTAFALLFAFSPAVAADAAPATPTIESILNEYHEQAFEAQLSTESATKAVKDSRSGDASLTLEQETVNKLTSAGYEAYHVTANNYDALEESLKTDFSEMGLDPNGSYFVVLDGGANRSSSTFTYNYEGVTYTMRYVTVAPAESGLWRSNTLNIVQETSATSTLSILDTTIKATSYHENYAQNDVPLATIQLGTVRSMIVAAHGNMTFSNNDRAYFDIDSNWTVKYVQVLSPLNYLWSSCASVEYVTFRYHILYVSDLYLDCESQTIPNTLYSSKYNDTQWQKESAIHAFQIDFCTEDTITQVEYHLDNVNMQDATIIIHTRP